jgi:hypothetical protein
LDGILLCFIVCIADDLAGTPYLTNQALGYLHAFIAPTSIGGGIFAGAMFEEYDNYDLAFYISGSTCFLAGVSMLLIEVGDFYLKRKNRGNKLLDEETNPLITKSKDDNDSKVYTF